MNERSQVGIDSRQIGGNPLAIGNVEFLGEAGPANIHPHEQHPLAGKSKAQGHVRCDKGLTLVHDRRGDGQHLLVGAGEYKLQVVAHQAEELGNGLHTLLLDHEELALGLARNLGQDGYGGEALESLLVFQYGIEDHTQVDDKGRYQQAEQDGGTQYQYLLGRYRLVGRVGVVDDAGYRHHHALGQGVLLTFLQQEDIEVLLDTLLSNDVGELPLVNRHILDFVFDSSVLFRNIPFLDFDPLADALDTLEQQSPLGFNAAGKLGHYGVRLRRRE